MRARSAAAEEATSTGGRINGNSGDDASDMDGTQERLESFARAIAQGFSFGPRTSCGSCHATLIDFDSKSAGFCERCWAAIETQKVAAK
jgi:hypothetical protein